MHKQENTSIKGDNQHFSAVLSPLTLSKLIGKHCQQFIGANKRYRENRKCDRPTPSKSDRSIDGPGSDHLLIDMKPDRVPGLTGNMNIPQRHKIPNDPIQIMGFYINGQERHVIAMRVKIIQIHQQNRESHLHQEGC